MVVAIRVVVVVGAVEEIKGEKECRTGADVGRSARRSPLRKKYPLGIPLTPPWLLFLRES